MAKKRRMEKIDAKHEKKKKKKKTREMWEGVYLLTSVVLFKLNFLHLLYVWEILSGQKRENGMIVVAHS